MIKDFLFWESYIFGVMVVIFIINDVVCFTVQNVAYLLWAPRLFRFCVIKSGLSFLMASTIATCTLVKSLCLSRDSQTSWIANWCQSASQIYACHSWYAGDKTIIWHGILIARQYYYCVPSSRGDMRYPEIAETWFFAFFLLGTRGHIVNAHYENDRGTVIILENTMKTDNVQFAWLLCNIYCDALRRK